MALLNILVKHERQDYRAAEVLVEGSLDEDTAVLVAKAREKLRQEDYRRYLFVTEHPLPPPRAPVAVGSSDKPYFDDDFGDRW